MSLLLVNMILIKIDTTIVSRSLTKYMLIPSLIRLYPDIQRVTLKMWVIA